MIVTEKEKASSPAACHHSHWLGTAGQLPSRRQGNTVCHHHGAGGTSKGKPLVMLSWHSIKTRRCECGSRAMCGYAASFESKSCLPCVTRPSMGPATNVEVCIYGIDTLPLPFWTWTGEVMQGGHGMCWVASGAVPFLAAPRTVLYHGGGQAAVVQKP